MELDPGFEKSFDLSNDSFKKIAENLRSRKRDKVLNIRVNSEDLKKIKAKAAELGVKYQTLIAEILHHISENS